MRAGRDGLTDSVGSRGRLCEEFEMDQDSDKLKRGIGVVLSRAFDGGEEVGAVRVDIAFRGLVEREDAIENARPVVNVVSVQRVFGQESQQFADKDPKGAGDVLERPVPIPQGGGAAVFIAGAHFLDQDANGVAEQRREFAAKG